MAVRIDHVNLRHVPDSFDRFNSRGDSALSKVLSNPFLHLQGLRRFSRTGALGTKSVDAIEDIIHLDSRASLVLTYPPKIQINKLLLKRSSSGGIIDCQVDAALTERVPNRLLAVHQSGPGAFEDSHLCCEPLRERFQYQLTLKLKNTPFLTHDISSSNTNRVVVGAGSGSFFWELSVIKQVDQSPARDISLYNWIQLYHCVPYRGKRFSVAESSPVDLSLPNVVEEFRPVERRFENSYQEFSITIGKSNSGGPSAPVVLLSEPSGSLSFPFIHRTSEIPLDFSQPLDLTHP